MNNMEMNSNVDECTPRKRLFSHVDSEQNTTSEKTPRTRLFSRVEAGKCTAVEQVPRKRLFSRVESTILSENDIVQNQTATVISSQSIKPNCPVTACVSEETSTAVQRSIIVESSESQQNFD